MGGFLDCACEFDECVACGGIVLLGRGLYCRDHHEDQGCVCKIASKPLHPPFRDPTMATAPSGARKQLKPERYSMVPWKQMDKVARVYGYGAEKYDDPYNYLDGYPWSWSIDAAFRHLAAFADGEDCCPDSKHEHAASVVFHMLNLLGYMDDHRDLDDRPSARKT